MSVGSKSRHLDRDSSALAPTSDPTTTTPILPQPSQSTRYSAYPSLPHRPAPAGARDHPVLRPEAPLRPYLGRGVLPAGGRQAHRVSGMTRPLHAPEHGGCLFGAGRESGRDGAERDGKGRPCVAARGGRPRRRADQHQLQLSPATQGHRPGDRSGKRGGAGGSAREVTINY